MNRSIGTSMGMRRWYARMPKCKYCPKGLKPKNLFKGDSPRVGICSRCFLILVGETMSSQWSRFISGKKFGEKFDYEEYITWLRNKIENFKKIRDAKNK